MAIIDYFGKLLYNLLKISKKGGTPLKAALKIIWFALAIVLQDYVTRPIAPAMESLADNINAFVPFMDNLINFNDFGNSQFVHKIIFVIILFLGIDIISGDIKGLIKGPIKLVFNAILYLVGFSIVFFLLDSFVIAFN